jgi:hypothetical protein
LELTNPSIIHSVSSLFELVGKTSGSVSGTTSNSIYLLFSGKMPDGITKTLDVVGEIAALAPGDVYDIGASEVGRLLDKPEFTDALMDAIAREEFGLSSSGLANDSQPGRVGTLLCPPFHPKVSQMIFKNYNNFTHNVVKKGGQKSVPTLPGYEADKPEIKRMAFINEKISEEDKARIEPVINHDRMKEQTGLYMVRYLIPEHWTIDRERNVYLVHLVGNMPDDRGDYWALGIEGQAVVFYAYDNSTSDSTIGIKKSFTIVDLVIPSNLEPREEEIKQLIRESLEENAYFDYWADGGTYNNPNTVARKNIVSFHVEFEVESE